MLRALDLGRAVDLVQEVCRIPSVLGEEGDLAAFLASVMRESAFDDVELQPVVEDRPNAVGTSPLGDGPTVVLTGHMDTKPVSHGWSVTEPFSGALIDGAVYGHGVMDMKAALACQIVAIEAVRASGAAGLAAGWRWPRSPTTWATSWGRSRTSTRIAADLCVLGELTDNQVCLGHRGRYYFDVTTRGRSAHTCHKPQAINANVLAAQAVLALDASKYEPDLEPWVVDLFGAETYVVPGRIYGGLAPGGPSMIPDECVIRVDCRPQPGVTIEEVRAEIDRCLAVAAHADPRFRRRRRARRREVRLPGRSRATRSCGSCGMAVREVRGGEEPPLVVENWLGDTASFGAKVPTVIFGPGGPPVYCPDEHLTVEDIQEATKVYAVFAALALTSGEGA